MSLDPVQAAQWVAELMALAVSGAVGGFIGIVKGLGPLVAKAMAAELPKLVEAMRAEFKRLVQEETAKLREEVSQLRERLAHVEGFLQLPAAQPSHPPAAITLARKDGTTP